ncbi:alcohol dehydrogenase catalytic domain-containing protein [Amnibacterium sp. CER49]|nr:alcohol dehydrogenase catalytic domain-containing protein [Amnibacterium sp. CER49]MDH2444026.1 alcohol dehydrogenase catalytic domain-containing protein [Amnibacterium sp. CER49]
MQALVVHGAGDLRLEERPLEPSTGPVVVRVAYGGICGSDLHYVAEGRVGAFALREPLVLGHEVVGTVEADPTGSAAPGTPVAIHPATADGTCAACRSGAPNVCVAGRYLGSAATLPHTQGGFAERIAVRADQLRPLPDGLPLVRAVLAEPLAVALHAITRAGGVAGRRVLVTGAGPIGLLAARAAVALGAASVTVTDLLERPLAAARALGATHAVRLPGEAVEPESADVVLEASGAPAAVSAAVFAAARHGVVVQIGMVPGEARPVALAPLIAKEVALLGSFRFDRELDDAIALLARDGGFHGVVSHVLPLGEAAAAFALAADPAASSKVVLELAGG